MQIQGRNGNDGFSLDVLIIGDIGLFRKLFIVIIMQEKDPKSWIPKIMFV